MSRPFDEARYKGLLGGLEAQEIPLSDARGQSRFDSEFWKRIYLIDDASVGHAGKTAPLTTLLKQFYRYPTFYGFEFCENGVAVLKGEDIDVSGLVLSKSGDHVTPEVSKKFPLTVVESGDIIVSVRGSVGKVGLIDGDLVGSQISPNLIRLSPRSEQVSPKFLWSFLASGLGQRYFERYKMQTTQETILASDIADFLVPILSSEFQMKIANVVDMAHGEISTARARAGLAEQVLLRALNLENWQPPEPLTYARRALAVFTAGRLDADYFAPRVAELLQKLGETGLTVGSVAPTRHERFSPGKDGKFDYIEISNVRADGTVGAERLPQNEAPSRATSYVRAGDVIVSSVRPIRRLSAIITPEQDGFVCSSGFVVLQPREVAAEVLLTYLRLPPLCKLMDLHTSASLYPAISETDLLALPFHPVADDAEAEIVNAVQSAHAARRQAHALLESAKRAVEVAVGQGETEAMRVLLESGES